MIFTDSFLITKHMFLYLKIANCLSLLEMVSAMITQIICIVGLILMIAVDLFVSTKKNAWIANAKQESFQVLRLLKY